MIRIGDLKIPDLKGLKVVQRPLQLFISIPNVV